MAVSGSHAYVANGTTGLRVVDITDPENPTVEGIVGTPDIVFDVEVTSNRPDCLGHIGVAREVSAMTGKPLKLPDLASVPADGSTLRQPREADRLPPTDSDLDATHSVT